MGETGPLPIYPAPILPQSELRYDVWQAQRQSQADERKRQLDAQPVRIKDEFVEWNHSHIEGRIFLAPLKHSPAGQCKLWVNLGGCAPWKINRELKIPPYIDNLSSVISKESYDEETSVVRLQYSEGNKNNFRACCLCCCTCGVCFCPLVLENQSCKERPNVLSELVAKRTQGWEKQPKLVFVKEAKVIDETDIAVDQDGQPCVAYVNSNSGQDPIWPPIGINLVFTMPEGPSFRSQWISADAPKQQVMEAGI